jgi:hypothetical protein
MLVCCSKVTAAWHAGAPSPKPWLVSERVNQGGSAHLLFELHRFPGRAVRAARHLRVQFGAIWSRGNSARRAAELGVGRSGACTFDRWEERGQRPPALFGGSLGRHAWEKERWRCDGGGVHNSTMAALQRLLKACLVEGAAYHGTLTQFTALHELRYDLGAELPTVRSPRMRGDLLTQPSHRSRGRAGVQVPAAVAAARTELGWGKGAQGVEHCCEGTVRVDRHAAARGWEEGDRRGGGGAGRSARSSKWG